MRILPINVPNDFCDSDKHELEKMAVIMTNNSRNQLIKALRSMNRPLPPPNKVAITPIHMKNPNKIEEKSGPVDPEETDTREGNDDDQS